jgi:hypothetical protein
VPEAKSVVRRSAASSARGGRLGETGVAGTRPKRAADDHPGSLTLALQARYTDGFSKASIGAERCRTKTHSAIALIRSSASLSGIERNGEWLLSR